MLTCRVRYDARDRSSVKNETMAVHKRCTGSAQRLSQRKPRRLCKSQSTAQFMHFANASDEELMLAIGRGDESAFDVLYGRYNKRLLYYFYRMLSRDEDKAQDFLHDIFLKILERPYLFETGRRFSTWVYSVAHNMCKNEYRRLSVRKTVDIDIDDSMACSDDILERLELEHFKRMLDVEIDGLDPEKRTTFILRYSENLSIREISDIIERPEGTVKSRLFYTLKVLSQKLTCFNPQHDCAHS